ncbi:hypothetical protein GQ57_05350 [Burkholderia sp. MSh2]|nr:hypothetical protein GQ57_05350 [Burkholderia sp. MSh2]KFG98385.1 hypothetical protein GQ56_0104890 [Burkholderia paludis]
MLMVSAAVLTMLAGAARADAPYVDAREVARCTRLDLRNLAYPAEARRAGQGGEVTVGGVVLPDGTLSDVTVLKSSGHAVLDDAVTAAFKTIHCVADEGAQPIRMKLVANFSLR